MIGAFRAITESNYFAGRRRQGRVRDHHALDSLTPRTFAGEDYEAAVVSPGADPARSLRRAQHYEVRTERLAARERGL
jgi:hypothetical protein